MSDALHPARDLVPVAMRTLGCKVNRVESEDIASELLGRGATLVAEGEAAVIVINTCTVTGEADAKARKAVRQALASRRDPIVLVTGCLASVGTASLEALGERVVVEADKELVAQRVADLLGLGPVGGPAHERGEGFRTRVQLKIQDGCDCFCTYCIVPHARGLPRSTPLPEVVERASRLASSGVAEVVLTGINLGRYRWERATLSDVVEAVARTGVRRIRLSSLEPLDLDDALLHTLASTPEVCAHLHIPVQSGSDAVLAAMGRGYTVADFERRLAAARDAIPGLALTTDLIAGFPTERDEDHRATIDAVSRIGFSKLHVFRYSERRGTPAAEMPERVDPAVRAARATELRDVGARLRAAHIARSRGSVAEVLVECVEEGVAEGTTREYLRARFDAGPDVAVGSLVSVVLGEADAEIVSAVPLPQATGRDREGPITTGAEW